MKEAETWSSSEEVCLESASGDENESGRAPRWARLDESELSTLIGALSGEVRRLGEEEKVTANEMANEIGLGVDELSPRPPRRSREREKEV